MALRSTGKKRLGEAGVHDAYYTIGMKLTNPRVLNSNEWNAKGNLQRTVLEKVRTEMNRNVNYKRYSYEHFELLTWIVYNILHLLFR